MGKTRSLKLVATSILAVLSMFICLNIVNQALAAQYSDKIDTVLVMDESGSMRYNDPNNFRRDAANLFVELEAGPGDQIGIIGFDIAARVYRPMAEIATNSGKADVHTAVGQISTGSESTDFNVGLQAALAEFQKTHRPASLGGIILLTDGIMDLEQPINPAYGADVELAKNYLFGTIVPQFKATDCPIYSIALTKDADAVLLQRLATDTGGQFFSVPSSTDLPGIFTKIFSKMKETKDILASGGQDIQPGKVQTLSVDIGKEVKEATFVVTKNQPEVTVSLVTPDSKTIDPAAADNKIIFYSGAPTFDIFTVINPKAGKWQVKYDASKSTKPASVSLNVMVYTDLKVKITTVNKKLKSGDKVTFTAEIWSPDGRVKDSKILDGMTMKGHLSLPDDSVEQITLYDDGAHGDKKAKDGSFSGTFVPISQGQYKIKVNADGKMFSKSASKDITVGVGTLVSIVSGNGDFGSQKPGATITKKIVLASDYTDLVSFALKANGQDKEASGAIAVNPNLVEIKGKGKTSVELTFTLPKELAAGDHKAQLVFAPSEKIEGVKQISLPLSFQIPSWWDIWHWPVIISLLALLIIAIALFLNREKLKKLGPVKFSGSMILNVIRDNAPDEEFLLNGKREFYIGNTARCGIQTALSETGKIVEIHLVPVRVNSYIEILATPNGDSEILIDGMLSSQPTTLYDGVVVAIDNIKFSVGNRLSKGLYNF